MLFSCSVTQQFNGLRKSHSRKDAKIQILHYATKPPTIEIAG